MNSEVLGHKSTSSFSSLVLQSFSLQPSSQASPPSYFSLLPFFFTSFFSSFTVFTNLSTVQATITDVTASPGFTSTMASPFVAARLRIPAASNLADLGAPLLVWMVAM